MNKKKEQDLVKEVGVEILVHKGKLTKKLSVFYNPVMEFNRTVSILLLKALGRKKLQIGLPLAGSGVRGIRFIKELQSDIIRSVSFNDNNKSAVINIKRNIKINKINKNKIKICNKDANLFMLISFGFDYIDIDPFGSPNIFLDSAVKRLARKGILAVTATDTGCLAGSFPKACLRKYWAKSVRNENMHETALRILIRKVQLIGADHDKALTPIYCYSKDHYYRVFLHCDKGKKKVDKIMKNFGMFKSGGPMWLGRLWDPKIAARIFKEGKIVYKDNPDKLKILEILAHEAKIDIVGFYNLPQFCKINKFPMLKENYIVQKLSRGFKVASTHFEANSLRSTVSEHELKKFYLSASGK